MGLVYIIRNKVNNKVYIGQTMQTLNARFNQHIWKALSNKSNTKLSVAIRQLGVDAFYIEKLVECNESELTRYEQKYVKEYNSINDGYNSVNPCSCARIHIVHDYEDKVLELYLIGRSRLSIAKELNISCTHVNDILLQHNTYIEYVNRGNKDHNFLPKEVIMYSSAFEMEQKFSSMSNAFEWLESNSEFRVTEYGAYYYINAACYKGNIAYGHRWQLAEDLVYEDKIFRTKFDKEAYINGGTAYQPEGKQYWVVDDSLESVKGFKTQNHYKNCNKNNIEYTCKQCGRKVNCICHNGLCMSCVNVIAKGKSPKLSRDELKALLDDGVEPKRIAEMCGRTESTIYYWIKSYKLK